MEIEPSQHVSITYAGLPKTSFACHSEMFFQNVQHFFKPYRHFFQRIIQKLRFIYENFEQKLGTLTLADPNKFDISTKTKQPKTENVTFQHF